MYTNDQDNARLEIQHHTSTLPSSKASYFTLRITVKYWNWSTKPRFLRFLSTCIWKFVFSSFRSTVQCKLGCCIHVVAQQDTYIPSSLNIFIQSPHWSLLQFTYYVWIVWSCEKDIVDLAPCSPLQCSRSCSFLANAPLIFAPFSEQFYF